jgi:hypothetical protein
VELGAPALLGRLSRGGGDLDPDRLEPVGGERLDFVPPQRPWWRDGRRCLLSVVVDGRDDQERPPGATRRLTLVMA